MSKIIKSSFIILAVAAIAGGASYSFFSDKETSTGNTFTAGNLDLKVDNQCHYDGMICNNGEWIEESSGSSTYQELLHQPCTCNWEPTDLTNQLFFKFDDVKPGDIGEDTASFHVNTNPAWVCAKIENVKGQENDCANNAEKDADSDCATDQTGELINNLNFSFFRDFNCNNKRDGADYTIPGTERNVPLKDETFPIFDSATGDKQPMQPGDGNKACIAMNWNIPSTTGNEIQGDSLMANITFYAEQSRNNPDFVCHQMTCSADTVYTASVIDHNQGKLKNGNPITDPNRTDPTKANGSPDWISGTGTNFYSLGKDGTVVLKFAGVVGNGDGDDLSIHEATNGRDTYPEEKAKVEVSLDGVTFYEVGTASSKSTNGVSFFDISGTPLSTFQYVRLTDTTDFTLHADDADGFDLDAVDAVYGACQ